MRYPRLVTLVPFACLAAASSIGACSAGPRASVTTALEHRDLRGALRAYEDVREMDEPDPELLASISALLLEQEAAGTDAERRDAAFMQLLLAGIASDHALHALAENERAPIARARALSIFAERGDASA